MGSRERRLHASHQRASFWRPPIRQHVGAVGQWLVSRYRGARLHFCSRKTIERRFFSTLSRLDPSVPFPASAFARCRMARSWNYLVERRIAYRVDLFLPMVVLGL